MSTLYIGLGHRARQGKNVVASELQRLAGDKLKQYALADELKRYCKENHDQLVKEHNLDITSHKDDPIYGYVKVLQFVGTDLFRKQDPDHWVKALDSRIKAEKPEIALITDVRFPNEANYIHGNNGAVVKVVRIKADGTPYVSPDRDPNHPSETALDDYTDWDFVILGADGELEALRQVTADLYEMLMHPPEEPTTIGLQ